MIQISTGKFFRPVDLYTTHHRGVLYTNYRTREEIETIAGILRPLEGIGDVSCLLYEWDERLEAFALDGRREFLVSVGGDYMIQDFSAIVSFALDITCTPDIDLVRRLTQVKRLPLGVAHPPRQHIPPVFEPLIDGKTSDAEALRRFVIDLVGLRRRVYESVMKAILRYVKGLHRVSDDPDLAYTLLVASLESLAQFHESQKPVWEDYDPHKRHGIDKALSDTAASSETRERLRSTILAHEHVALGRRFREFTLEHIRPSFFRSEARNGAAIARRDLPGLLDRAYISRSKYVHTLRELPRIMTALQSHADTVSVHRETLLTFAGLARVARHVIGTVVGRSEKVDREDFNYRRALPNVVQVQLAESMWLHLARGFDHRSAARYLSGFLRELAAALSGVPGATLTDMSEVMESIEKQVPGLARSEQRLPMLVLYGLYQAFIRERRPSADAFLALYNADLGEASIEAMIAHLLIGDTIPWPPDDIARMREAYYKQRERSDSIQLPPIFEAALALELADARRVGDNEVDARRYITEAVENLPGHPELINLETAASSGRVPEIRWRTILLPARQQENPNKDTKSPEPEA